MKPRQPAPGEHQHFARLTQSCARCHKPLCQCSDWDWRSGTAPTRYSRRNRVALIIIINVVLWTLVAIAVDACLDRATSAFRQIGFDNLHGQEL